MRAVPPPISETVGLAESFQLTLTTQTIPQGSIGNRKYTAVWADESNPTVSDIGGGTALKATSASLNLKCTDTAGITGYYWGTTNPSSATDCTTTTSASLTALSSTSGLNVTVSAAGTYYLAFTGSGSSKISTTGWMVKDTVLSTASKTRYFPITKAVATATKTSGTITPTASLS